MENLQEKQIVVSRSFEAPLEVLWKAWTEPEQMKQWMAPEGMELPVVEADVRVGGAYQIQMLSPEGNTYTAYGKYREITPPERLVYTWSWKEEPHNDIGETVITVTLADADGATEVTMHHEGLPTEERRKGHEEGWTSCLNRLEGLF